MALTPLQPPPDKTSQKRRKGFSDLREVGLFASIPFMFLVGPGLGYLAGRWLESHYIQAPWGVVGGVLVGFMGAIKAMLDTLNKG